MGADRPLTRFGTGDAVVLKTVKPVGFAKLEPLWDESMARQARERSELSQWRLDGPIDASAHARMMAHPAFAEAANRLVINMLALRRPGPGGEGMFRDAGHYVAGMLAIYLHASGGLTMQRLRAYCASTKFLSPGRARAMLIYMQYLGFVELLPTPRRGASARYLPTARFVTSWRHHLRLALEAAAVIAPGILDLLDRFDQVAIFERFATLHCEALMQAATVASNHAVGLERIFLNRLAGADILNHLIGSPEAAERDAGALRSFPPGLPVLLSAAGLARICRVSRLHVSRMLDDAEAAGMIVRGADGTIVLGAAAIPEFRMHYASQLLCLLDAAAGTVAGIDAISRVAPPASVIGVAQAGRGSSDRQGAEL